MINFPIPLGVLPIKELRKYPWNLNRIIPAEGNGIPNFLSTYRNRFPAGKRFFIG
jgi:hypothetical protein